MVSGMSFPLLFFNCRNFIVSVFMDVYGLFKKKRGPRKIKGVA
jgi:hypothetical protein